MTSRASRFESLVAAGTPWSRAQAEEFLADPDLITAGMLGEQARRAITGDRVTFGRVLAVSGALPLDGPRAAGEVRLVGVPASLDEARVRVREARAFAASVPLTGFSLADLLALAGADHLALADLARALRQDGLEAVAEAPLDQLGDTDNAIEVVRAALHGGLGVWRATVAAAPVAARLDLIERAVAVQGATGALRAFAPLPRFDATEAPATGYDDVRTIAATRLMCRAIPLVQVDWPLYGPKLAQVAIAYGANDIDGIAAADTPDLGHRRSPREDIERQIRAAGAVPAERNGRYDAAADGAERRTGAVPRANGAGRVEPRE